MHTWLEFRTNVTSCKIVIRNIIFIILLHFYWKTIYFWRTIEIVLLDFKGEEQILICKRWLKLKPLLLCLSYPSLLLLFRCSWPDALGPIALLHHAWHITVHRYLSLTHVFQYYLTLQILSRKMFWRLKVSDIIDGVEYYLAILDTIYQKHIKMFNLLLKRFLNSIFASSRYALYNQ